MRWQPILDQLAAGQQLLDRQTIEDCARLRGERIQVYCSSGCCNCCSLTVNCSFAEALLLARNINPEQRILLNEKIDELRKISLGSGDLKDFLRQFRDQLGGCPLLIAEEGNCSLYPQRPYSCRALLSTRNSNWCAVDFATLHPLEKEAFLSSLDPEVVAFPTHYLAAPQETGLELESVLLRAMREEFGVSLSGNLIYLLWLELEHQLSGIIPQGFVTTRRYLEEHQLDLPFLLQLQSK